MKDVCVLIPTLNEEEAIGKIIREFKAEGFDNILVIDGNSTDNTREIARKEGAKVVVQRDKGKGAAIKQAFEIINSDIIVIIDGDGTYSPAEAKKLIEPIIKKEADHVIGNRFAYKGKKGVFKRLNKIGNIIINKIFSFGYGVRLNDILSGYRALTREVVEKMRLGKKGFEIEAEMTIESIKKGFRIKEVPITYAKRKGETKLHPIRDGSKIIYTIYMLARTHNPLFYFGVIGFILIAAGLLTGIYVVIEWYYRNISHDLLTVFTALLIISGIQFFIFGLLGDFIVSLQKELMEEMRRK
ncbi:MAG: S-layer glycoprotein N-glycosyltransferase AglJ [Candidatus Methanospirareceae archaeon]